MTGLLALVRRFELGHVGRVSSERPAYDTKYIPAHSGFLPWLDAPSLAGQLPDHRDPGRGAQSSEVGVVLFHRSYGFLAFAAKARLSALRRLACSANSL